MPDNIIADTLRRGVMIIILQLALPPANMTAAKPNVTMPTLLSQL